MSRLVLASLLALMVCGCRAPQSVDVQGDLASARLGHPYPNPFDELLVVPLEVFETQEVEVVVQNPSGLAIRTLVKQVADPGRYMTQWDGRNRAGEEVRPGLYFVTLRTPEGLQSRAVRKE
ncbi:MAG: hypothetical protein ONB23_08515 [candidate division KSB1 bacterium]|nr:hypothetical protein [candidate division KSB1 bacterium]